MAGDCNSLAETHAWFDSRVAHHFLFLEPSAIHTREIAPIFSVGYEKITLQRPYEWSLISAISKPFVGISRRGIFLQGLELLDASQGAEGSKNLALPHPIQRQIGKIAKGAEYKMWRLTTFKDRHRDIRRKQGKRADAADHPIAQTLSFSKLPNGGRFSLHADLGPIV